MFWFQLGTDTEGGILHKRRKHLNEEIGITTKAHIYGLTKAKVLYFIHEGDFYKTLPLLLDFSCYLKFCHRVHPLCKQKLRPW